MTDQNEDKRASIEDALSCPGFKKASQRVSARAARFQKNNSTPQSSDTSSAFIRDPRRSLDFDVNTSDDWNGQKLMVYVTTMCQMFDVKNWCVDPGVGERRAIKENKTCIDTLSEQLGFTRAETLRFMKWWFDSWKTFERVFPKAAEVGYCPPFWIKAWLPVKKFRDFHYQRNEPRLDSNLSGDNLMDE